MAAIRVSAGPRNLFLVIAHEDKTHILGTWAYRAGEKKSLSKGLHKQWKNKLKRIHPPEGSWLEEQTPRCWEWFQRDAAGGPEGAEGNSPLLPVRDSLIARSETVPPAETFPWNGPLPFSPTLTNLCCVLIVSNKLSKLCFFLHWRITALQCCSIHQCKPVIIMSISPPFWASLPTIPLHRWMDKEVVVHIYNGTLPDIKRNEPGPAVVCVWWNWACYTELSSQKDKIYIYHIICDLFLNPPSKQRW